MLLWVQEFVWLQWHAVKYSVKSQYTVKSAANLQFNWVDLVLVIHFNNLTLNGVPLFHVFLILGIAFLISTLLRLI